MKATFDLTKLWKSKPKHISYKNKPANATRPKNLTTKDNGWDMSPEDALRVAYSGHK
jgi:hypothetical protein